MARTGLTRRVVRCGGLSDSQTLTELQVKELCLKAREILVEEANIQWIDSPVTVSHHSALGFRWGGWAELG